MLGLGVGVAVRSLRIPDRAHDLVEDCGWNLANVHGTPRNSVKTLDIVTAV
jgi:hypothetical protein